MKRLSIFASYDVDNIIDDYIIFYLKELSKFSDIIYVSDCNIIEKELDKIKNYCIHIINGRHGEYDFGSYKRGFIYANENNILKNYDYLILCNDSVYGPFFNLENIINSLESKNTDVYSMFHCFKDNINNEHLQSYFISMNKNVFLSYWYFDFINSIHKEDNKDDIIFKYEEGMTSLFKKHGCSICSFLDSSIIEDKINSNIPYYYPFQSINHGFPFLKILLFRKSLYFYFTINEIINIFDFIKGNYNLNIIINHLNRVINKEDIKYLFRRFKELDFFIINKHFIKIKSIYMNNGKYRVILQLFSFFKLTIDIPKYFSFVYNKKYKDFSFILDYTIDSYIK